MLPQKNGTVGVSTHKNEGSAKDWAIYTAGDVRGASSGSMSAKEWAVGTQGRGVAGEGSAKDWATRAEDSTVDNFRIFCPAPCGKSLSLSNSGIGLSNSGGG